MDAIETYLRQASLTAWDVVDILIVAFVLYEFMKLMRGTRAVQMAVGSAIIALLFIASRWAPLQTVNWIVRNMFGYVVFAAIVIFQSDIRRALAHFGRAPFFRALWRTDVTDETIEEVMVASTLLADKRTGGIIVLERAIGLRNYVESGIPLEATVTHDLLVSIFQTTSPLHDGAVVIQENRISAAACFLPLTVNPQLSRELGTRHRAAIGLTEESDAVVIVISEETGKISLALDGRVERGLDATTLVDRLRTLMTEGHQSRAQKRRERARGN